MNISDITEKYIKIFPVLYFRKIGPEFMNL